MVRGPNLKAFTKLMKLQQVAMLKLSCYLMFFLGSEYIGLFDIVTTEKYRNRGYGSKLIQNILQWGKENGAKYAYLQVILNNTPALNYILS
ncbi:GNAT family N-acetyltransferase [Cytobacillus gottheilii]|uniref:GNAT family N-acetyltransferase n=1 Tax=Cytobacillus gottheilii TaxID=859144 RepID=UPI00082A6A64|nr:GNAT family N-acetyltransferase [Cytobacillus gottheilii]